MSGSGKTVFVTGGGGYVASHSIIELLKDDFNVVAVDNFVNSIRGKLSMKRQYIRHIINFIITFFSLFCLINFNQNVLISSIH